MFQLDGLQASRDLEAQARSIIDLAFIWRISKLTWPLMSLFQTVCDFKEDALNSLVCPIVLRLGIQAIPAVCLLLGEVTLSSFMHYGIILPSPIGVDLLEFPVKMAYILERRRTRGQVLKFLFAQKFKPES